MFVLTVKAPWLRWEGGQVENQTYYAKPMIQGAMNGGAKKLPGSSEAQMTKPKNMSCVHRAYSGEVEIVGLSRCGMTSGI